VAARGLDIPDVDWIVQYDPPDDPKVNTCHDILYFKTKKKEKESTTNIAINEFRFVILNELYDL